MDTLPRRFPSPSTMQDAYTAILDRARTDATLTPIAAAVKGAIIMAVHRTDPKVAADMTYALRQSYSAMVMLLVMQHAPRGHE